MALDFEAARQEAARRAAAREAHFASEGERQRIEVEAFTQELRRAEAFLEARGVKREKVWWELPRLAGTKPRREPRTEPGETAILVPPKGQNPSHGWIVGVQRECFVLPYPYRAGAFGLLNAALVQLDGTDVRPRQSDGNTTHYGYSIGLHRDWHLEEMDTRFINCRAHVDQGSLQIAFEDGHSTSGMRAGDWLLWAVAEASRAQ